MHNIFTSCKSIGLWLYRDGIITTKVKGVPIILDDDIWTNVAQLTIWDDAVKVHLGVPDFNRLLAFQSFLRHPKQQTNRRQLLVGGFKVEECLIHYLIVWLLCPRATNHAQCSEQDILLLYGILNHIHIDWPALISDTMLKDKKYHAYHLSYALLISRILEYKGVNVEGELTQTIRTIGTEIGETTFRQMGFIAWMMITKIMKMMIWTLTWLNQSELLHLLMLVLPKQLKDMSLAQQAHFDQIFEWQQTHEEYVIDQFNDFDTHLGNIENHLNLHPPEKSPSPEF
ncbi:hypothetical protein LR48_Vigan07g186800 [Vigna angularis]|uniref:Uncharacterized protein n=1 Tax=Phaseolus angularis TaxID=3914 RepID=A0A0L9V067_PHAAN|nr:hypothetical protein LR48_Vigan07g186800 [Vigna angularis]